MVQSSYVSELEQVADTMISLTGLSNQHRTIIAGSDSMKLYQLLRRRGFIRIFTTATYRIPKKQHSVGLIVAQNSPAAIDAALTQASCFLANNAAIAVLIESRESEFCMKVRRKVEQLGFRIEAGVRCHIGLVLSASRQGTVEMKQAA